MKRGISLLIACVLVSVLVLGCKAKPAAPAATTAATTELAIPALSDGKYRPPQGNYAYDFSLEPGDRLDEYYWPSSFETVKSGDFGDWKSIEFMRISDEFLPIPEDPEARKKYLDYDLNALMERRITPEVPD